MSLESLSKSLHTVTPTMADAIDQNALTVETQTPLTEVLHNMSTVWGECAVSSEAGALQEVPKGESFPEAQALSRRHSSCVVVVEQGAVTGIFTERDIVKLTAAGYNFETLTVGEVMTSPVKTLQASAFQDIFAVLFLFRRYRIRHLPIVDDQSRLIGVVTPESIRQVLRPANLLKMRRVADVMTRSVLHAPLDTPVLDLANLMAEHRVSCVVIAHADSQETPQREIQAITPIGIVTERDIVQFQALQLNLKRLKAKDIMSSPLFLLSPEDSLWAAHEEMKTRRVRRLVVSWNWGGGLGLVTQTSLLKVFDPIEMYGIIETMQQTIHQLKVAPDSTVLPPVSGQLPSPAGLPPDLKPSGGKQGQAFASSGVAPTNLSKAPEIDIANLLIDIEARLISLATNPDISEQQRQSFLNSALGSIQQIQAALQG